MTRFLIGLGAAIIGLLGLSRIVTGRERVSIVGGRLRGPTGVTYELTGEDMLWLARAAYGEAGLSHLGVGAVCWALAQNFMLVPNSAGEVPRFATFSGLVRAYCQPVNPEWADANSAKCRQNPEACTDLLLERRRYITGLAWYDIPDEVTSAVRLFAAGAFPNPVSGCTDWASRRYVGARKEIAGNWFGVTVGRRLL